MEQGISIRKIAKGLNICIQTSFNWRHKILSSLEQFVPRTLSEAIECDELELTLNNKGSKTLDREVTKRGNDFKRNKGKEDITVVQVVTAVERKGNKYLKTVESKRLSKEEIEKIFEGKLSENATSITEKHPSFRAYAKDNLAIKHYWQKNM